MENMRTDSNTIQSQIVVASSQINSIQDSIRGVKDASQVVQTAVSTCETKKSEVSSSVSQLQTLVSQLQAQVQQLSSDSNQQAMEKMRQDIYKATPPGTIAYFAADWTPDGWLRANGQLVSRTVYKDLFVKIGTTYGSGDGTTTFAVPDLRGEFVRGWDDARGVDVGRNLGSTQLDAVQRMQGTLTQAGNRAGLYQTSGVFQGSAAGTNCATVGQCAALMPAEIGFDSSLVARTSSETRSRNMALLACIKY